MRVGDGLGVRVGVVVGVGDGVNDGAGDGVSEGRIVSIGGSEIVAITWLSGVGLLWKATCCPEHAQATIPRERITRINQDRFNDSPRLMFTLNSGKNISLFKLFAPTYWRGEDNHHNYAAKPSRRGE
jgi:hypothetical protein